VPILGSSNWILGFTLKKNIFCINSLNSREGYLLVQLNQLNHKYMYNKKNGQNIINVLRANYRDFPKQLEIRKKKN